ncbi:hypothetical protein N656DRAFT_765715 [Canariomyces notabilis]|uniref:Protein YAE1 n=1 Tax=Canariomyces notabilis TaxID=2074819 RepID=A0AAN6TML1_9PEZI|nr:hypothetical protein N656DRAFT_765715 [Canariomyces arenarius]
MTSHNPTPANAQPDTTPSFPHEQQSQMIETLDDVWADDDEVSSNNNPSTIITTTQLHSQQWAQAAAVISDMPRLRQAHSTAGYRDGSAAGRSAAAQAGFDEGFGLGATIGARAGQLLGVLEGLAAAVGLHALSSFSQPQHPREYCAEPESESARLSSLLAEARRELSVQGVFAAEYWAADGNWAYEVPLTHSGFDGTGTDGEVVFADVAAAHPLLKKWGAILRQEADRYGVDWEVLKDDDGAGREGGGDGGGGGGEWEGDRPRREKETRLAAVKAKGKEAFTW